jgi:hypothetical protein
VVQSEEDSTKVGFDSCIFRISTHAEIGRLTDLNLSFVNVGFHHLTLIANLSSMGTKERSITVRYRAWQR